MKKDRTGVYPVQVRLTPELYDKARILAFKEGVTVNKYLALLVKRK